MENRRGDGFRAETPRVPPSASRGVADRSLQNARGRHNTSARWSRGPACAVSLRHQVRARFQARDFPLRTQDSISLAKTGKGAEGKDKRSADRLWDGTDHASEDVYPRHSLPVSRLTLCIACGPGGAPLRLMNHGIRPTRAACVHSLRGYDEPKRRVRTGRCLRRARRSVPEIARHIAEERSSNSPRSVDQMGDAPAGPRAGET